MQVWQVMTRGAEHVAPDETIETAARKMRDLNIGLLPVCSADRLIGVVTDRDITIRATAEGRDPRRTRVREVMTHQVFTCFEEEDLADAVTEMEERAIRRLLVLDRNLRLTGVLSVDDVAKAREREAGQILHRAIEPVPPP